MTKQKNFAYREWGRIKSSKNKNRKRDPFERDPLVPLCEMDLSHDSNFQPYHAEDLDDPDL